MPLDQQPPSGKISKCPRCKKMFTKTGHQLVCAACEPHELADYEKVSDVLAQHPGMGMEAVAELAGVSPAVILRMLDSGRLEKQDQDQKYFCGRCGKPAISKSKRLCQACLMKLDQEWAEAMRSLRETLNPKPCVKINDVHGSLEARRNMTPATRLLDPSKKMPEPEIKSGHRMVTPEKFKKFKRS
ncbi:MAG TPA: hypothetical protein PLO53_09720 [Candidatus Hydrogenedentes bacterium]|nr:hypothetical protein [Candidatus Hydrogenedentota bacterium]HPU98216.1 hypothetical protein [Candidatus Hydrogenedentota bacterium]